MPEAARRFPVAVGLALSISMGCGAGSPHPAGLPPPGMAPPGMAPPGPAGPPSPQEADWFIKQTSEEYAKLESNVERAGWVKETFITDDTEKIESQAQERLMEFVARKIHEARRFEGLSLPPDVARQLYILKYSAGLPAPADPAERAELAETASKLSGMYGKGKYCSPKLKGLGKEKGSECLPLEDLSAILATKRDYDLLLEAWRGWHSIAKPMRPLYQRMIELGNKGASEIGFKDVSEIWTGQYDMSPEQFREEMTRLWNEVRPLYEQLHCYARAKLRKQYGEAKIPKGRAPIPAHLLGNMWAQEWGKLYPLLEPYKGKGQPDITKALVAKKYDAKKMVELGERFFVSLGLDALPKTFWERSMFTKPRDRDVVCHAST